MSIESDIVGDLRQDLYETEAALYATFEYMDRMDQKILDQQVEINRLRETLTRSDLQNLDMRRMLMKGEPEKVKWRPSTVGGLVILIIIAENLIGSWPASLF
jgi:hypothetical protein